jgi:hypothetical protein
MISRTIIVWFVLLTGFSGALFANQPEWIQPCITHMSAHPNDVGHENLANPCDRWSQDFRFSVKLFAIGCWVSWVGLLCSLVTSLYCRIVAIRRGRKLA